MRHYHTLIHLGEIFARLDGRYTSLQQPRQLAFATFFHDSIYEPTAKDNELRSAQVRHVAHGMAHGMACGITHGLVHVWCTHDMHMRAFALHCM